MSGSERPYGHTYGLPAAYGSSSQHNGDVNNIGMQFLLLSLLLIIALITLKAYAANADNTLLSST